MLRSAVVALQTDDGKGCSPDVEWYFLAEERNLYVYVINPLIVDHRKDSYSNTWKSIRGSTKRGQDWAGKRNVFDMLYVKKPGDPGYKEKG